LLDDRYNGEGEGVDEKGEPTNGPDSGREDIESGEDVSFIRLLTNDEDEFELEDGIGVDDVRNVGIVLPEGARGVDRSIQRHLNHIRRRVL
ncbi:hypothetical protein PENTCL1PPCAC_21287, partial [Pristionchus entomophagus]